MTPRVTVVLPRHGSSGRAVRRTKEIGSRIAADLVNRQTRSPTSTTASAVLHIVRSLLDHQTDPTTQRKALGLLAQHAFVLLSEFPVADIDALVVRCRVFDGATLLESQYVKGLTAARRCQYAAAGPMLKQAMLGYRRQRPDPPLRMLMSSRYWLHS